MDPPSRIHAAVPAEITQRFDATSDAIVIVDDRGQVVHANPVAAQLLALQRKSTQASSANSLLDLLLLAAQANGADSSEIVVDATTGASELRSAAPESLAIGLHRFTIDGERFSLIRIGPATESAGALTRDGSLRSQVELLLTSAADGVCGLDTSGRITFANPAAASLLDYPMGGLTGQTMHSVVHESLPDGQLHAADECPVIAALRDGAAHRVASVRFQRRNGVPILVDYESTPLWDGERIIGMVMTFRDVTGRQWNECERRRLLRLERRARSRAEAAERRAEFLAEASQLLAASLDYPTTVETIVRLPLRTLADYAIVDVVAEDGVLRRGALAVVEGVEPSAVERQARPSHSAPPASAGPSPPTASSGVGPAVGSASATPAADLPEPYLAGESRLELPLVSRGDFLGVLTIGYLHGERRYQAADVTLARELARRCAVSLDHARAHAAERHARSLAQSTAERIARLQTVTASLVRALTPKDVAAVVIEHGKAAAGANAGSVYVVSPDGQHLQLLKASGYSEEVSSAWREIAIDATAPLAECVRLGRSVWIPDAATLDERYPGLRAMNGDSVAWAAIPLAIEGRTVGAIGLSFASTRAFTDDERSYLLTLAQQCAMAIERTRLYQAEHALRNEAQAMEARYRGLFEESADAIVVAELDGRIVDLNGEAARLFGAAQDQIVGRDLFEFLAIDEAQKRKAFRQLRRGGRWQGEIDLRQPDGRLMPVEARTSFVKLPNGTLLLGVYRDISERRSLERLQREFLATVSHELRNPLTSIIGFGQILRRRQEYLPHAVDSILRQADRLNRLVGDLLDVARLEAGRLEIRRERCDVIDIVRRSAEQAAALTTRHQIIVDAPECPIYGSWDRLRIEQVLHNLLSNAVKYSPDGGEVRVTVQAEEHCARVSVRDYGIGLSQEAMSGLFQRFQRGDQTSSSTPGIGLGLYISRWIVEAHGGRLTVDSTPGEGSTFTFTLPYEPSKAIPGS